MIDEELSGLTSVDQLTELIGELLIGYSIVDGEASGHDACASLFQQLQSANLVASGLYFVDTSI